MRTDQNPLTSFERELLTELRTSIEAAPQTAPVIDQQALTSSRPRAGRTGRRLVAAAAAAGIAIGGGALLNGGSPAFAIESTGEGITVIRIHDLDDSHELETALHDVGLSTTVEYPDAGQVHRIGALEDEAPAPDDLGSISLAPPEPGQWTTKRGSDQTTLTGADAADACDLPAGTAQAVTVQRDGDDLLVTIAVPPLTVGDSMHLTIHETRSEAVEVSLGYPYGADLVCRAYATT